MLSMRLSMMLLCCLCIVSTFAQSELKDNATGAVFPSDVSFDYNGKNYHLQATGVSTRKKFFVTVYSVAHYLQDGTGSVGGNKFQAILQDDKAKQLSIKWARSIDSGKVQDGFQESFKKALSQSDYAKLQNAVNEFVGFFNKNVNKGDESVIKWAPGGYVEVDFNGNKVGSLTNTDFAKGLWTIWFGEKSVVDRNQLVSLLK